MQLLLNLCEWSSAGYQMSGMYAHMDDRADLRGIPIRSEVLISEAPCNLVIPLHARTTEHLLELQDTSMLRAPHYS